MKIGTKSVLFGAHCFFIHPFFVAAAWTRLYGFPLDPRLWVAFFVHDLGYIGKPNLDGPEGETHPELGAKIMGYCFDPPYLEPAAESTRWHDFTVLHSRYYAKKMGRDYSRLCVADKLATAMTWPWLYLPMVKATGEIREYMAHGKAAASRPSHLSDSERAQLDLGDERAWFAGVQSYLRRWAMEHVCWEAAKPLVLKSLDGCAVEILQVISGVVSPYKRIQNIRCLTCHHEGPPPQVPWASPRRCAKCDSLETQSTSSYSVINVQADAALRSLAAMAQ